MDFFEKIKNKKVLALDVSLNNTGYVLEQSLEKYQSGVIKFIFPRQIQKKAKIIKKRIFLLNNFFDWCIIENYGYSPQSSSMTKLGEITGLIKYFLWMLNKPILLVAPTMLKKFITGKGNAKKDIVIKEVFKQYNFDTNDNNQADAFGLFVIGKMLARRPIGKILKRHLEICNQIKKTAEEKHMIIME